MEYGAVILGPPKSGNSGELEVRFADGVVDDWEIEEFREPVHHLAGGRKWRIGEVIDIDTEDGLEKGATIMGPATGGGKMQVRRPCLLLAACCLLLAACRLPLAVLQ